MSAGYYGNRQPSWVVCAGVCESTECCDEPPHYLLCPLSHRNNDQRFTLKQTLDTTLLLASFHCKLRILYVYYCLPHGLQFYFKMPQAMLCYLSPSLGNSRKPVEEVELAWWTALSDKPTLKKKLSDFAS